MLDFTAVNGWFTALKPCINLLLHTLFLVYRSELWQIRAPRPSLYLETPLIHMLNVNYMTAMPHTWLLGLPDHAPCNSYGGEIYCLAKWTVIINRHHHDISSSGLSSFSGPHAHFWTSHQVSSDLIRELPRKVRLCAHNPISGKADRVLYVCLGAAKSSGFELTVSWSNNFSKSDITARRSPLAP